MHIGAAFSFTCFFVTLEQYEQCRSYYSRL